MERNSKIVIIGAGNVGTTLAYSIINQGLCRTLVMIDINKEKVAGEVLDMKHACMFMERKMEVRSGDYDECKDAEIVVVTACAPMDPKANNRLSMMAASKKIMDAIVPNIMASGFSGILLIVSNPVDIMTYYARKISGLSSNKVLGSGTVLDTARLTCILSELFDLNPNSIDVNVIGEHGDSEVIVWSTATIGGKRIDEVMKDNKSRIGSWSLDQMKKDTADIGWKIFHSKGSTTYGIGSSVARIIKSIMNDEESILPVSVCMEGIYGFEDVNLSLPAVLNKNGIREIVELKLSPCEMKELKDSYLVLKENIKLL